MKPTGIPSNLDIHFFSIHASLRWSWRRKRLATPLARHQLAIRSCNEMIFFFFQIDLSHHFPHYALWSSMKWFGFDHLHTYRFLFEPSTSGAFFFFQTLFAICTSKRTSQLKTEMFRLESAGLGQAVWIYCSSVGSLPVRSGCLDILKQRG